MPIENPYLRIDDPVELEERTAEAVKQVKALGNVSLNYRGVIFLLTATEPLLSESNKEGLIQITSATHSNYHFGDLEAGTRCNFSLVTECERETFCSTLQAMHEVLLAMPARTNNTQRIDF